MKSKRRAPYRYHAIWRCKNGRWCELTHARIPKNVDKWVAGPQPIQLIDLLTGEVLKSNLGDNLRAAAFVATNDWPVRKKAGRAIKRFYAPKPPKNKVADRQVRLAKLRGDEKRWVKKFKLAHTKLRKIRAAIKRAERNPGSAGVPPASSNKCGNCYDGKLLMSGETCGMCGNKEL